VARSDRQQLEPQIKGRRHLADLILPSTGDTEILALGCVRQTDQRLVGDLDALPFGQRTQTGDHDRAGTGQADRAWNRRVNVERRRRVDGTVGGRPPVHHCGD